jgi:hypothetical protein
MSRTSTVKRDALIGRTVRHTLQPEADPASRITVSAVIEGFRQGYPLARIVAPAERAADGSSHLIGRTVRLDDIVHVIDCTRCHYTAGHVSWCPLNV